MRKIGLMLLVSLLLLACKNEPKNSTEIQEAEIIEEITDKLQENKHLGDLYDDLKLSELGKWEVNEEMKPHLQKIEGMVTKYISSGDTEYQKLAENLKEENDKLIRSCTMKGESHDELHKWLHPYLAMVKELSTAPNQVKATEMISEINLSMETFHKFFE